MSSEAYAEVAAALDLFFDGFYEGDIEKLKRIFYPNCHLFSAADGPLVDDSMEEVYEFIRTRLSPASRGQPRYDRIISIDVAAPESAMAKVQLAFGDRFFTDYLSLLRIDEQWRIISKTFTYVLLEVATVRLAAE
mgnify:CR=1 FL=1